MSPVEFIFIAILIVFGLIGIVRGAGKELGVTAMLLIGLLLIKLLDTQFRDSFSNLLQKAFGVNPQTVPAVIAMIAATIMIIIAFISYQGASLSFHLKREAWPIGLGAGLINGYLFAGSLWFYLQRADWPLVKPLMNAGAYTDFNRAVVPFLPPNIFDWKILIFLVVGLLILRVWK